MQDFKERFIFSESESAPIIFSEHLVRYEFAREVIGKLLLKNPEKKISILDIACGSGYGADLMSAIKGTEVLGVDLSKEAIKCANEKYKKTNLRFKVGDATNIPEKENSFDAIISFETIEHLENREKYLKELVRVLKKGGVALLSTPNRAVFKNKNPFHNHEFLEEEFVAELKKVFKEVKIFIQRNSFCSIIENNFSQKAASSTIPSKLSEPLYFIAACSKEEIKDVLPAESIININHKTWAELEKKLKIIDSLYLKLVKIPGMKKIIEKIKIDKNNKV